MTRTHGLFAAAALAMSLATPALADDAKGYRVTYDAGRDHYCLQPVTATESARLGIRLYHVECRSAVSWALIGLTVDRRR